MALRDLPYIPLYVQDFMTDEKLIECSPAANGIYIRLMCVFHKSAEYGTILLKQKDKERANPVANFAIKLSRFMPWSAEDIKTGLEELIKEDVIQINGDRLSQKRMIADNELSETRSKAGKEGGYKKHFAIAKQEAKVEAKAQAKRVANTEDESESENDNEINNKKESEFEIFRKAYPGTKRGHDVELADLKRKHKDWKEIIPILMARLNSQIDQRAKREQARNFVPQWKNLKTYLYQRSWEEEIQIDKFAVKTGFNSEPEVTEIYLKTQKHGN